MVHLTENDRLILDALRRNSRETARAIAESVGLNQRTVSSRITQLEDSGVIRQYTIRESGAGLSALIRIKVSPGAKEIGSLGAEIRTWSGVDTVFEIAGEADLIALVHVSDTISLRTLLDRIWESSSDQIASTITELVLEQY